MSHATPIFTAFFTSEILNFGFLSMKESLNIPKSVLIEYKWAKGNEFSRRLKTLGCWEIPNWTKRDFTCNFSQINFDGMENFSLILEDLVK